MSISLSAPAFILEGQTLPVELSASPPGSYFLQGTVKWGNSPGMGATEFSAYTSNEGKLTLQYQYHDDGPSPGNGTPSDDELIEVSVDSVTGPLTDSITVTVQNIPPTGHDFELVNELPAVMHLGGPWWRLQGWVEDAPMWGDRMDVTVNWGDGSEPYVTSAGTGEGIVAEHQFLPTGQTYTVQVTVNDDDAGEWTWSSDPVRMYLLDLDNDANNSGAITAGDEAFEPIHPGQYISVNDDDDNENGTPDIQEPGQVVGEDDLEPINLAFTPAIRPEVNNYIGWHVFLRAPTHGMLWESADKTTPLDVTQTFFGYGRSWEVGDAEDPIPSTLYVEAGAAGSFGISLELFKPLNPDWAGVDSDGVMFTGFASHVDIAVDSNNDEMIDATDEPLEMDDPGAIVGINDNDDNENGQADHLEIPMAGSLDPDLKRVQLSWWLDGGSMANLDEWTVTLAADAASGDLRAWREDPLDPLGALLPLDISGPGHTWNLETDPPPDHIFVEALAPVQSLLQVEIKKQGALQKKDAARVVAPRAIIVRWATYSDNRQLDANPAVIGDDTVDPGFRIFPEKKSYGDAETAKRRTVLVEVDLLPLGVNNVPVYLHWWDIDDPTSSTAPLDANDVGIGTVGGDNFYDPNFTTLRPKDHAYVGEEDDSGDSVMVRSTAGGAVARLLVSPQPANNYQITATTKARANMDLAQEHVDGRAEYKHAPDIKASRPLTVWRTLHVEEDSFAAPTQAQIDSGIFDADEDPPVGSGDPNFDWDINPGDIGEGNPDPTFKNPSIEFAKQEFRKTMVELEIVPASDDPTDDTPFLQYSEPDDPTIQEKSDTSSSHLYWAVQLFASYEYRPTQDYDSDLQDTAAMGVTTPGGVIDDPDPSSKRTSKIELETIRDVARNKPTNEPGTSRQKQSEHTIIIRVVFHELLHLFAMPHAKDDNPDHPWETNVMLGANVIYGSDAENALTDIQAAHIRAVYRP